MPDSVTLAGSGPAHRGLGRDYRRLWSASTISTLGDGVSFAALPLLATTITTDPILIAALAATTNASWLLLSVVAGAVSDRFDRRTLMVLAQCVQAVLVAVIGVLAVAGLGRIWPLYPLAFGLGAAEVLFEASSRALVPTVVGRAELEAANGRLVAAEAVTRDFAGPPLGAALFAFAIPLPFWLDAVTFVLSILLLSRIRTAARTAAPPRRPLVIEIAEGLRWLGGNRLVRNLTVIAAAGNFCEAMPLAMLVLYAHQVLGLGAEGYGLLLAGMAVGGVLGGLVSRPAVDRFGGRSVAIGVQVAGPVTLLAIGLFGRSPVVVVALFTLSTMGLSLWNVMSTSLRQRATPNELLGRVSGASRMITRSGGVLGALAGGAVASALGPVAPWIAGALLNAVVVAAAMPTLLRWTPDAARTR